jgi:hypothetical protein
VAAALVALACAGSLAACGQGSAGQAVAGDGGPVIVPGSLLAGPLGCPKGVGVIVLDRVAVQLEHPYTVVVARCDSGAGSPPSGVYVVQGDPLRVSATLVGPSQELEVSALTAVAGRVQVTAAGYSGPDVPRCCPDRMVTLAWQPQGDQLVPALVPRPSPDPAPAQ